MSDKTEIEVAGKKFAVSHLGKVPYPEVGFTKAQVFDYHNSDRVSAPAASQIRPIDRCAATGRKRGIYSNRLLRLKQQLPTN